MVEVLQGTETAGCGIQSGLNGTTVELCDGVNAGLWNAYVNSHPEGTLFHRAEWEHVFNVYGLKIVGLAALHGDDIVAVLPLVWQRSLPFGNQLVSIPWFDACGILADDAAAANTVIQAARETAQGHRGAQLQLRQLSEIEQPFHVRRDKVLMRLPLPRDSEALWSGFKPSVRNQIRRAEKAGLIVHRDCPGALDEFYDVYSHNMRDLGSPPHSRGFFGQVLKTFSAESSIYTVRLNDRAVGAGLVLANGVKLEIPWASSLRAYNRYCVNNALYWRILQDACVDGFDWFHFGRSTRDSGTFRFKKQWGAEPVQLHWYFTAPNEQADLRPTAPEESFGWAQRLWKRFPLPLARMIGPYVISRVP